MDTNPEIQFEFIKVAIGYTLLGVLILTAIITVLSIVRIPRKGEMRQIIDIQPTWFRRMVYTSLILEIIGASVLFFQGMLTFDTQGAAEETTTAIQAEYTEFAGDLEELGIVRYWKRAADFLPHVRDALANAEEEVWISGASFYISVPDNEELIAKRANEGVRIHYLILDPDASNLPAIARTFNQTADELRAECEKTVVALDRVYELIDPAKRGNLEVRLFNESPRARFYIFDPSNPDSHTFFVPHVNAVNSPKVPGFLLKNKPFGLAGIYNTSVREFWNQSLDWTAWRKARTEDSIAVAVRALRAVKLKTAIDLKNLP